MIDCKFCEIVSKVTPANVVFENDHLLAFLDIRPLFHGHTLLVPKSHYTTLYDTPDSIAAELFVQTKVLGKVIEKAMQAGGSFIALNNVVSQSVPHLHVHIVPRNKGDGLKGFFWPRAKYASLDEMKLIQERIIQQLQK